LKAKKNVIKAFRDVYAIVNDEIAPNCFKFTSCVQNIDDHERELYLLISDYILQQNQRKVIAETEGDIDNNEQGIHRDSRSQRLGEVKAVRDVTMGKKYPFVNADEILKELQRDWRSETDQFRAGREAVKRYRKYFEEEKSFIQETTLTGNTCIKLMLQAKESGYQVTLHYIGVENAEIAVKRVENRVRHGGHGIPREDIERRYTASLSALKTAIEISNIAYVYDNTTEAVDAGLKIVAVYSDGKTIFRRENELGVRWFGRAVDSPDTSTIQRSI
jgi:predicted ABC-type ATPase